MLAHLYRRAEDLSDGIEDEVLESDGATELVVDSVIKRNALCVATNIYDRLQ